MNQAARWKAFVSWWDREFPAQSNLNKKYTASQVVNKIGDKVFELKHGLSNQGDGQTTTQTST